MKILYYSIIVFGFLSVNIGSSFAGTNPSEVTLPNYSEARVLNDKRFIAYVLQRVVKSVQTGNPLVSGFAFSENLGKGASDQHGEFQKVDPAKIHLETDSIEIKDAEAVVYARILLGSHGKRYSDRILLRKENNMWRIFSSNFLFPLWEYSNSQPGRPVGIRLNGPQPLSSTNISVNYSQKMLFPVNVTGTSQRKITRTDVQNAMGQSLFNYPVDVESAWNSATTNDLVSFYLDLGWNRIVIGKYINRWIGTFTDARIVAPTSMAVSPSYEIYVAIPSRNEIVKLQFNYQTQSVSFVQSFSLPNIYPHDIVYDKGFDDASTLEDVLWVADPQNDQIVKLDRQCNVIKRIAAFEDALGTPYQVYMPRKIMIPAIGWYSGDVAFISGDNSFVVLATKYPPFPTPIGARPKILSFITFSAGSYLTSIGLEPPVSHGIDGGYLLTDRGLHCIHKVGLDYAGSFKSSGLTNLFTLPRQLASPVFRVDDLATVMWFHTGVLDDWSATEGLQDFYPGADALNLSVDRIGDTFEFRWTATSLCSNSQKVVNPDGSEAILPNPYGGSFVGPGEVVIRRPASQFQFGSLRFKVSVQPYYNGYYGQYSQPWLEREIEFNNARPHLTSTSLSATATNNQRKIAQSDNGTYCMVYEADNHIWLTKSADGVNWSSEICVSQQVGPPSKYPSIVVDGGIANIVWQHQIGTGEFSSLEIHIARYNIQSDVVTYAGYFVGGGDLPSEDYKATPVIDAFSLSADGATDNKMIAWRDPSGIHVIDCNNGSWGNIGTVSGTHGNCSYPSIAVYNGAHYAVCWEDASAEAIKYIECAYDGSWAFDNAAQISPYGWYLNQRPSLAIGYDNQGCANAKVTIAWQSVDNVVEGVSVHVRDGNFACSNWGSITSYSMGTGAHPHAVVGSFQSSHQRVVMWNVGDAIYYAGNYGSYWESPKELASGTDGGAECSITMSSPSDQVAVWRKPSGHIATYQNPGGFSARDGSLSMTGEPLRFRRNRHGIVRVNQALGHGNGRVDGMMAFEIARMTLTTSRGIDTLEFSEVAATNKSLLSSKPFRVQANTTLNFAGAAYGKRLAVPRDSMRTIAQPIARVVLRQRGSSAVRKEIWTIPFSDIASMRDSTYGTFRRFDVNLDDIVGRDVYVDVEMLGHGRVEPLIDDDYLIMPRGTPGSSYGSPLGKSAEKAIPRTYGLYQNYPNPFNPSTVIRFDLPEAQVVSLKVFNVLGEEVMTVANGLREAGEHSINADFTNLPTGMYIYRMNAGKFSDVKKLLVVK